MFLIDTMVLSELRLRQRGVVWQLWPAVHIFCGPKARAGLRKSNTTLGVEGSNDRQEAREEGQGEVAAVDCDGLSLLTESRSCV